MRKYYNVVIPITIYSKQRLIKKTKGNNIRSVINMNNPPLKVSNLPIKVIMIIILVLSIIQIFKDPSFFAPYILQGLVFGVPVWMFTGAIAPYLIYFLVVKPVKSVRKNLYILKQRKSLSQHPMYYRILTSVESSLGPTLLTFGILNLALNYFDFVFELGFIVIVIVLVFCLGLVVPFISVIADSDLIVLKEEKRAIEPFGLRLQSYLHGISSFTAFLGLTYNLLTISGDIAFTITVLSMIFSMIYPTLVIIKVIYDQSHPFFVDKLNKMLEKSFKPCKVVVKIGGSPENCYFTVEYE